MTKDALERELVAVRPDAVSCEYLTARMFGMPDDVDEWIRNRTAVRDLLVDLCRENKARRVKASFWISTRQML